MKRDLNKTYGMVKIKGKKDELSKFKSRILDENIAIVTIFNEENLTETVSQIAGNNKIVQLYNSEKNEYIFVSTSDRINNLLIDLVEEMELNAVHIFTIMQDNETAKMQRVYEFGFLKWGKTLEKNNVKICC